MYEELRKLAAAKMAQEKPGQTLQATALVHEAYIRLVDVDKAQHWDSPGAFLCGCRRGDAADLWWKKPGERDGHEARWARFDTVDIDRSSLLASPVMTSCWQSDEAMAKLADATICRRRSWSSCGYLPE